MLTIMTPANTSFIAAAIAGAIFIWTGAIKAVSPHTFRDHLRALGWLPEARLPLLVTAGAALEVAWGVAIITGVAPGFIIPASIVVLALLSIISWLGVRSGRVDDCGCYGGFLQPSIWQSIGINSSLAGLLAYRFLVGPGDVHISSWQIAAALIALLSAGGFAQWSQHHETLHGTPPFAASPLVVGAAWRNKWAANLTKGVEGEFLVAMLGAQCPYCKQWVKIGNATIHSPILPRVFGVMGGSSGKRDDFVSEHRVQFPVAAVSNALMGRLARAVPTTVRVEGGVIRDIWVGQMPPEFVVRFRDAFFPGAAPVPKVEANASGATT